MGSEGQSLNEVAEMTVDRGRRRKDTTERGELAAIRERNQAALKLLKQWQADESGYDEAVWPELKKALEEDRISDRKLFSD